MRILFILLSAGSLGAATIKWDALDPKSGVVGYDIHYGPTTTPSTHVSVGNVVTAVIPVSGSNYFTVTGRDGANQNSKPSNQVLYAAVATPTPTPVPTPSPPVLASSLSWNAVQHATKYRVYENNVQIAEQTVLTYSLAGKVGPKTYTVSGVNSANAEGSKSNSVNLAAPTPTPTPTPTPVPVPAAPVLQIK